MIKLKEVGKNIKKEFSSVYQKAKSKTFISKTWKALVSDGVFWISMFMIVYGILSYVNRILKSTGFDVNNPSTFSTIAINQSKNALIIAIVAIFILPIIFFLGYLIYSLFIWLIYFNKKFTWKKAIKWFFGHIVLFVFGIFILGIGFLFISLTSSLLNFFLGSFIPQQIMINILALYTTIIAWFILIFFSIIYFNILSGMITKNKIWQSIAESWNIKKKAVYMIMIVSFLIVILNMIYMASWYFIGWLFLARTIYMLYYNPLSSK